MKVLNIIFIIYCIIAAALQYNDPDPYVWIPIYLYTAYLCFRAIQRRYNPVMYYIGLAIYLIYAVYLFYDKSGVLFWAKEQHAESLVESMKATKPWIEETREFFGLLILVVMLLLNMLNLRKK